jgi:hypothetical protein
MAPRILNLATRWLSGQLHDLVALPHRKKSMVSNEQNVDRIPKPVWTLWATENSAPPGIELRGLGHSYYSPAVLPAELSLPSFLTEQSATVWDRGCRVVSVTDPYGHILGFLHLSHYYSSK